MSQDELRAKFDRFWKPLKTVIEKYEEANPDFLRITLLQIVYQAIENLRRVIEDPGEKAVTWERPFVSLEYPVQADWETLEPLYFRLTLADLEDPEKARAMFVKGFVSLKELYCLRLLTREILLIIPESRKPAYKVPVELDKKLSRLKGKEREGRLLRILESVTKLNRLGPLYDFPVGTRQARLYLDFRFGPCVLNVAEKRAYYPIQIGLEFRGVKAKDIPEETRAKLWEGILAGAGASIPKQNWDFLDRPRTEPTARPVTEEAPRVKVGIPLESQKFGTKKQLELWAGLSGPTKKDITEQSIDVIGLDLSQAQNQALFAIQKIFSKNDYKGNTPGKVDFKAEAFSFRGYLPALKITPAEYLEAYGLKKHKTARGWEEYSGEERRQAIKALEDLTNKFLFVYKQSYPKRNERGKVETVFDVAEKVAPLILLTKIWEGLKLSEEEARGGGASTAAIDNKLKAFLIEPSPMMVKGLDRYYLLKPANYMEEIKFLAPHASKYVYLFIDWLIYQAGLNLRHGKSLVIREGIDAIATHLHMTAYIKNNMWKRIRQTINKCYKTAKDLGYLLSYETVPGKGGNLLERLELNPEKFRRVKAIQEERGRLEETKPAR